MVAGVLAIVAGIVLLISYPVSVLLLSAFFDVSVGLVLDELITWGCVPLALYLLFGVFGIWAGWSSFRTGFEGGWGLLAAGVAAILIGIFLLGGILGIIGGALFVAAAGLIFVT